MLSRNRRTSGSSGKAFYSVWNKAHFADGLLHPCMSDDGITWTTRSSYNTYTPTGPMMGCPTLLWHNNKLFIAASRGVDFSWTGTSVEIASTTDGDTFTHVASPDFAPIVSGGTQQQVWTESWFKDSNGDVYLGVLACPNGVTPPYTTYLAKASNSNLTAFDAPVAITGSGLPSGFFNVTFTKVGATYHMFYKNENGGSYPKYMEAATSSSLTSGYSPVKTGDWAGWGSPVEAPVLRRVGSRYRIWLDYEGAGIYMSDSATSDPLGTWSAPAVCNAPFGTQQHGSIVINPFG